ncbi:hypothetical protein [Xanthomonas tesorieronis]|uniref:hypothetical protein n=1 Tax=Xanthomonas tesorieronis TaxID=3160839 RepID=UPI00351867F6
MSSTLYFFGEKQKHKPKSRLRYDVEAERVATALVDWPLGFQALLHEMYGEELLITGVQPPFYKCFSWVLERLVKNDSEDGRSYDFVLREVFKFGAKYWTHSALSRTGDAHMPARETIRWGTIGEAGEILGLHPLTMRKLIKAGELPVRRVSLAAHRQFIVDLNWARRQRVTQEPAIGPRDAAKVVGVSIFTLRAMVQNGIYVARHRPASPSSLAAEDIRNLARRLKQLLAGKKPYGGTDAIDLDRLFIEVTASPLQKAEVFAYLLENPALVVGKKAGTGMGVAQVRPRELHDIFQQLRERSALGTLFDAGRRIGCSAAVATALRRAGYLDATPYAGRLMIIMASVEKFVLSYESLASISNRIGIRATLVYRLLKISKLRHVKVITQCETIFIHRCDVPKAEEMIRSGFAVWSRRRSKSK